jgi:mRNA interferase MazF
VIERGSVVLVAGRGDYGKPRPAVVVQSSRLLDRIGSITVCLVTSDLTNNHLLRIPIEPNEANGLRAVSQIQVEKIMTFPTEKVRGPVGNVEPDVMRSIDIGLLFHLDLVAPLAAGAER